MLSALAPKKRQKQARREVGVAGLALHRADVEAADRDCNRPGVTALVGDWRTAGGAADADYTPLARNEEYTRRMPCAELAVLADTHHAVPVERPDEFNRIVLAFLLKQAG